MSKEGYIVKRGRFRKSWLRRWFVLSGTQIEYFKDRGQSSKGVIVLLPTTAVRTNELPTASAGASSRSLVSPSGLTRGASSLGLKGEDPYEGLGTAHFMCSWRQLALPVLQAECVYRSPCLAQPIPFYVL